MEKNNLGKGWVLGETLITGIGQGYIQTTPLQLMFNDSSDLQMVAIKFIQKL